MEIGVQKKNIKAQYVAFSLMGEDLPDGALIDHMNGDPWDNSWGNLRSASKLQNAFNRVFKPGKNGVRGVEWDPHKRRWRAVMSLNGKVMRFGRHLTKGLAAVAYAKASLRHHGKFSIFYSRNKVS